MTVLSGSIKAVYDHTTSTGPNKTTAGLRIMNCHIVATFSGTYVQGDNAQILAADDAIEEFLRTGSTVTLVDAAFAQAGIEGSSTTIGAKSVTVSGSNITLELTTGDLSTEHAGAALSEMSRGIDFFISYTLNP